MKKDPTDTSRRPAPSLSRLLLAAALLLTLPTLAACSESAGDDPQEQPGTTPPGNNDDQPSDNDTMITRITLTIGGRTFPATLAESATTQAFVRLLPMTLTMHELNGNEKYHNLNTALPTDASRPGTIQAGDLRLYGDNCVVLFYETFASSYSYTPLGTLDTTEGLRAAVGTGSVQVTFAVAE